MAIKYRTPINASTALAEDNEAINALIKAGWEQEYLTRSNGTPDFIILHRVETLQNRCLELLDSKPVLTSSEAEVPVQSTGSNILIGSPKHISTLTLGMPSCSDSPAKQESLKVTTLPTLQKIRRDRTKFVIAIDTEFYYPYGENSRERSMLTYQFSFAEPVDESVIHSVLFASCSGKRLELGRALGYCLRHFGIVEQLRQLGATNCKDAGFQHKDTRVWYVPLYDTKGALWDDFSFKKLGNNWVSCSSFDEALEKCVDPTFKAAYEVVAELRSQPSRLALNKKLVNAPVSKERDSKGRGLAGYQNDYFAFHNSKSKLAVPVTVLCHAGKADLTGFDLNDYEVDVLRMVSDVQGGLVSLSEFELNATLPGGQFGRFYPLDVSVKDTMCFAAAKHKGLDELGEAIGLKKLVLPEGYSKDAMQEYLSGDPVGFVEYAARDAVVTLCYAGTLFGFNKDMPVTASAAASAVLAETIKNSWGLKDRREFDRRWRGIMQVDDGKAYDGRKHRFRKLYREEPVGPEAAEILMYARNAYMGGANGCSSVGWIPGLTHDLDLCSAYPTAMSCCMDVDWDADDLYLREWRNEDAVEKDFENPFDLMWAYVDAFEFPESVKYPCISMNVDGCIIQPRTLGDCPGIYVTGVEIWSALRLGAKIHIKHGYKVRYRTKEDGKTPTRSLFEGVYEFVRDRGALKQAIKNGAEELKPFEQLEKTMVNSVYGKTAQNIIEKSTWDAFAQEMVDLGSSPITSPAHASITTAIVRCILMLAMNQLNTQGYNSYSYTTDGFITDADEEVVNKLDLYGMAPYLRQVRLALSDNETLFEEKHWQEGFLNLTTRGNISLYPSGVRAHNSYVSPYDDSDPESMGHLLDGIHCLKTFLSREDKVDCISPAWARFRDMADQFLRDDFFVEDRLRQISMDFDLKRRPVKESLTPVYVVLLGEEFDVCNVETVPYETPEEYKFYKARGKSCNCLRTKQDWERFFVLIQNAEEGVVRHVTDLEWSRLFTCVMGHRLGVWRIPTLDDASLYVSDKIAWINQFNHSKRVFNEDAWKNARRQDRITSMLPVEQVCDLLAMMGAVDY